MINIGRYLPDDQLFFLILQVNTKAFQLDHMLGAILGDIVGSTYEFANTKDYNFDFFPAGSIYTDDTVLTVAVADAILNKCDYGETIRKWALRYPHPKGAYGSSFTRWMHADEIKPYGSYGNGSAMRVSPVGWLFDTEQVVLDEARKSAACTHNHPEGIKGAQATAIALYFARKGKEKLFIRQYIAAEFGYDLHKTVDEIRKTYLYNESCQGTVPEALICFLESDSFEDAIRKAISIGGDSDTIGAITGAIAEAFYDIPVELANKARSYLPNDMLDTLKLFGEKAHPMAIDLNDDTKQLRERFRKLKKIFSELFMQKQNMLLHEQPLLTALYLQKIGSIQYKSYCLEVELAQLKQRLSLLQIFVNRNEKPDLNAVDKEIEIRFSEYQQKIEFDAKQLAAARDFLKGSFLSPEESKRIKEVYYIIVKRLHPDINPDSDERMNELFVKAQTAYELSDLPTLQQILVLLDNKESDLEVLLPDLQINVNRLAENISTLEHQIEQLYQSFPFIYEEKLRDEEWVKNECEEMSIKIDTIKQEIEKYKKYITLLEEWKPVS